MKKTVLLTVALALLALPSFAALQYEFTQKSTTDDAVVPMTNLTAKGLLDGDKSRIDFMGGNLYPPGTYVITTDGSRRLFFVDPIKSTYNEINAAGVATTIGASNIKIENLRSKVDKMTDRPFIAGLETEHHQITINYDITYTGKNMPLKQSVTTVIDNWTTDKFGNVTQSAVGSSIRTGNIQIDELMELETSKLKGFPLRQTVTVKMLPHLAPTVARSQLKIASVRTVVREMWVTSVREVPTDPKAFTVPVTYRRAEAPELPKAATQVLEFDPPAK